MSSFPEILHVAQNKKHIILVSHGEKFALVQVYLPSVKCLLSLQYRSMKDYTLQQKITQLCSDHNKWNVFKQEFVLDDIRPQH